MNIERKITFDLNGLSMEELSILRDSLEESIEKIDELYSGISVPYEEQCKRADYSRMHNTITSAIDDEWDLCYH